jgi:hypothetical protein
MSSWLEAEFEHCSTFDFVDKLVNLVILCGIEPTAVSLPGSLIHILGTCHCTGLLDSGFSKVSITRSLINPAT